ncbi:MAG TPA: CBS domain-containing protein [Candidatus Wirthbacteria bacterium]|nr:CBS domain-containing protein [Candidatus Wirthbacteria bacterium]
MKVSQIMTKDVITVSLETSVGDVARILVKYDIKGVPVINEQREVLGIITECDLILQNAKLHIPSFIQILDGVLMVGAKKSEEELKKIVGSIAREVMTSPAIVVPPDMEIADLSTLMWEKKINPVPVVEDGHLVGIVSRADIVRLLAEAE